MYSQNPHTAWHLIRPYQAMDLSSLFGSLICTYRSAQKWASLATSLKVMVREYSSRTDWALKTSRLPLLGCFAKYPKLSSKITDDVDFGRRLLQYSEDDFASLCPNNKKNIKLCLNNAKKFDQKRNQMKKKERKQMKKEELQLKRAAQRTKVR